MRVSFQMIAAVDAAVCRRDQPFQGFCLDSRFIKKDQLFIALTSYSQPEKTRAFAEAALAHGALGVICEQPLGSKKNGCVQMCATAWVSGNVLICSILHLLSLHGLSPSRGPMVKPPFHA